MESFSYLIDFLWGVPLILFVVLSGIYFSINIKFIQILKVKTILKRTLGNIGKSNSYKTITSVLGGTVGSGNIAGIATAISIGGPGAIFWMWIVTLFSMATKFFEVVLAVKNQKKDNKEKMGGAMYYIKSINGKFGEFLALFYSIALLVYVICDAGFIQINTVSTSLENTFNMTPFWAGILLTIISLLIVKGGLKRVSNVLGKIVPIMCAMYILFSGIVILINIKNIPNAFGLIFKHAFKPAPAIGGFAGASVLSAISKGASRGILANEAGTGTSATVHATTNNKPIEQGLWGILEVMFVSYIMCTITALLVLTTGAYTSGFDGAPMVLEAFNSVYGPFGKYILCAMISLFAYTTYIGFFFEYTACIRYLFKKKWHKLLNWAYIVPLLIAVFMPIKIIWSIADISVGFIVVPNIIALIMLTSEVKNIFEKEKTKIL